jgi:gamma-glutamylcyclotransferase (GGCT)/AIG2-like uncharacterized protein YtfP
MVHAQGRFVEKRVIDGIAIYDRGCGFPFAKLKSGSSAIVEIYEVDEHNIHVLDRLEGYDPDRPPQYNMYVRHLIEDLGVSIYLYNSPITSHYKIVKGR